MFKEYLYETRNQLKCKNMTLRFTVGAKDIVGQFLQIYHDSALWQQLEGLSENPYLKRGSYATWKHPLKHTLHGLQRR